MLRDLFDSVFEYLVAMAHELRTAVPRYPTWGRGQPGCLDTAWLWQRQPAASSNQTGRRDWRATISSPGVRRRREANAAMRTASPLCAQQLRAHAVEESSGCRMEARSECAAAGGSVLTGGSTRALAPAGAALASAPSGSNAAGGRLQAQQHRSSDLAGRRPPATRGIDRRTQEAAGCSHAA